MNKKTLIASVIGLPNVGKSTLINTLVGAKVAITNNRPQTTRVTTRGVFIIGNTQIVISDTPGIIKQTNNFVDRNAQECIKFAVKKSHCVIIAADSAGNIIRQQDAIKSIVSGIGRLPHIIVMTKQDLCKCGQEWEEFCGSIGEGFLWSSSADGLGIDGIKSWLSGMAVDCNEWPYDEECISDSKESFWACEIVREKLIERLREELPYSIAVLVEQWKEDEKSLVVHMVVYVERESHKSMVIGSGAKLIKEVGIESRMEMSKEFDKLVHLFLRVKTKEKWRDNKFFVQSLSN